MSIVARLSYVVKPETSVEAPEGNRVLDLVHLARQSLGDPGLEKEILRIYSDASHAYCGRVQSARNLDELKISLHSLKGASAGVGATFVASAARAAEAELRETGDVCAETRADLAVTVEEVNTYISELLKG